MFYLILTSFRENICGLVNTTVILFFCTIQYHKPLSKTIFVADDFYIISARRRM